MFHGESFQSNRRKNKIKIIIDYIHKISHCFRVMRTLSNAEMHAALNPYANFALKAYLQYVNEYLTVEIFAEHKGITLEFAKSLINEGRRIHKMNDE